MTRGSGRRRGRIRLPPESIADERDNIPLDRGAATANLSTVFWFVVAALGALRVARTDAANCLSYI
ncbi:hypothetical protein [Mycobacterium montefiorense]|uniref:hypothetical protein n=1 Tax=Mycobacterium montefiorense TaxID=154654 RepID=UPI0010581832|nr:hypothetical protein [Mycobacterium montefiorense]